MLRPEGSSVELADSADFTGAAFTVNATRTSSSPRFLVSFLSGLLCSWYHLSVTGGNRKVRRGRREGRFTVQLVPPGGDRGKQRQT